MIRLLLRFKRNGEGATALEFGLIAIPLFFLIMATVELALVAYVSSVLDGVVTSAARIGITGNEYTGDFTEYTYATREELIEKLLKEQASALFDPNQVHIKTEVFADITAVGPIATPVSTYGIGGEAVLYTLEYDWKIVTPMIAEIFGDENGVYKATASVLVQNEGF